MSVQTRRKKDAKTLLVRVVCLSLAGLMLLSVIMATVWQW